MILPHTSRGTLFAFAALFAGWFWLGLALLLVDVATRYAFVVPLVYLVPGLTGSVILTYVLAHLRSRASLAALRSHAIETKQVPDLHGRLMAVLRRLRLNENAVVAFAYSDARRATSFSLQVGKTFYVALSTKLLRQLAAHPSVVDFYIGYEIGRRLDPYRHWRTWLYPATVLPLLGPMYARANVHYCDYFGLRACKTPADAPLALVLPGARSALAKLDIGALAARGARTRGFVASLLDLISPLPSLMRRVAYLQALATKSTVFLPRRHPLAYLPALFIPAIAPPRDGAFARALLVALWAAIVFATGQHLLARLDLAGGGSMSPSVGSSESAKTPFIGGPYARLDTDLITLGKRARAARVSGAIPCDPEVRDLTLNFPAQRYVFSCSEPLVYTRIQPGEFEPGREAYTRTYNWETQHFVPVLAPARSGS